MSGDPPALVSRERPAMLARDRAARGEAQTRFDRPLVLEAGAGTGKTTTLIARLLAWCLGDGWEKAAAATGAGSGAVGATGLGGAAGDAGAQAAEATAARVLLRVVALTFTEAAAAEMAERAAHELQALARGGAPPDWLAAARLPQAPELARRSRALLAALDRLAVQTFHAFCLGLLSSYPLAAGVHPRLQVDVDGRLLQQVIAEVVEAALRPGYGAPGDPHLLALAAQGSGPREIADALAALVDAGLPVAALDADPLAGDGCPRLCRRLAAACTRLHELLLPRLAGGSLPLANALTPALAELAAAAVRASGAGAAPGDEARLAGLAAARAAAARLMPANLRARLAEWGRGQFKSRREEQRFGEVREPLAAVAAELRRLLDHLDDVDPERLLHGRLALAPLLAAVAAELRRRGIATFDSLLLGARRLLAEHPEVRAGLRRGIEQLLVDEFQDTDATQCEVLAWLALDGPPAERPGLFLVGDPKQSIYGWRSADLRAYQGFVDRVVAAGGEVLPLVENFRSVPAILDEVARVVAPVMRERRGVQPPFAPLVACDRRRCDPGFVLGGRGPVEHWVTWSREASGPGTPGVETGDGDGDPETAAAASSSAAVPSPADGGAVPGPAALAPPPAALPQAWLPMSQRPGGSPQVPRPAEAAALEAAAIAADLRQLHELYGVPWRAAAILLRGTGDLDVYLDALRRAGIPFAVGRDKQFFRRREVIDAAALVRAVVDPGDHLALVTWLRSPMVGVPDAALMPLWRRELPRLLTELHAPAAEALAAVREAVLAAASELPDGVPGLDRVAGWELCLLAAVEQLAVLRESFAVDPADLFIERLRRLALVDVTAAARFLGSYRLANLDRFFRRLLAEIEQGSGDVAAVMRALRTSVAAGREAEEGRPPEGAGDAVQVLTIHGAKGLDFTHVYLPQLHKPAGGDAPPATAAGRLEAAPGEEHRGGPRAVRRVEGQDELRGERPPAGLAAGLAEPHRASWEYRLLGAATPAFDLLEERRSEVEAAERVRTLYVAMTRAKDRLVLAGAWPLSPAAPPRPELARSHLQLLAWRPACPDLAAAWSAGQAQFSVATAAAVSSPLPANPSSAVPEATADGEATAVAAGVVWCFPALAPPQEPPSFAMRRAPLGAALAPPAEVEASAQLLAARQASALLRMARPFGSAASEEAHAALREALAERRAEGASSAAPQGAGGATPEGRPAARRQGAGDRALAMAAGAALHRALELWDLGAAPRAEAERQRALLPAYLAAVADGGDRELALPRCRELLDRFVAGGLAARLHALAPQVLARELPVLLPPPPDPAAALPPAATAAASPDTAAAAASAAAAGSPQAPAPAPAPPVGFIAGAVDLLYRDAASGELVIADYKTDEVAGAEVAGRAALYASQGEVYVRAVRDALDLDAAPRFELWFVHAGAVVTPTPRSR
jgi:ATP-dependent exoDNAse (exonuclease V) beta subunit